MFVAFRADLSRRLHCSSTDKLAEMGSFRYCPAELGACIRFQKPTAHRRGGLHANYIQASGLPHHIHRSLVVYIMLAEPAESLQCTAAMNRLVRYQAAARNSNNCTGLLSAPTGPHALGMPMTFRIWRRNRCNHIRCLRPLRLAAVASVYC